MMRCAKCQKLFDAAADGSLSDRWTRKVRDHLAVCPACSLVWQENEGLRLILRETSSPAAMPDAAYFARLARVAVEKAESERVVSAPVLPKPGLAERLAELFGLGELGVEALARGVALVAVGLIAGFILSRNLVSFERRASDLASTE
ncbi:zf-HC2 domain-containing protein, partial [Candidatus Sumerlaeota bacterium]|nr:zf-HC2 domain-containing protein [Candidatus Sumerlaeota bacterium]